MDAHLETDRLILRRFTADDAEHLISLDSDPVVMRYISAGEPTPAARIREEVLPRFLRTSAVHPNFGYWAACEKPHGEFVGWFQFRPHPEIASFAGEGIEIGYRLRQAAWGQGYATSISRRLIARGFSEDGVQRVFARAMAANGASIRVMEKVGLKFCSHYRETMFPGEDQRAVVYALTPDFP